MEMLINFGMGILGILTFIVFVPLSVAPAIRTVIQTINKVSELDTKWP